MGRKEFRQKNDRIIKTIDARLGAIASWNAQVPGLKRWRDSHEALRLSLEDGPDLLDEVEYEPLSQSLDVMLRAAQGLPPIPIAPISTGAITGTSVASVAIINTSYASFVRDIQPDNPQIVRWAERTEDRFRAELEHQRSAEDAGRRLALLSPKLAQLHRNATNTTSLCSTGMSKVSDAANDQRLLIEKLGGELVARCKVKQAPKGKAYEHIGEHLVVDSPVTNAAMAEVVKEYHDLHNRLTDIQKANKPATGTAMIALFNRINVLVNRLTGVLDPSLTGINFEQQR